MTEARITQAEAAAPAAAERLARRRRLVAVLQIAVLVVVLGAWELCSRTGIVDPFFFGMPSEVVQQIGTWIAEGTSLGPLWVQVLVTLEETLLGFAIGALLGVLFGVALGRNQLLADVFGNAFQGVREADRNLIANARILGASPRQVTWSVIMPSALGWILASLHVSFGFALVGAVVGEFLGARQGIGLLIATAQGAFNANGVFAAMFILAVVALAAESLITLVENRLLKWRPNQGPETGF